MLKIIPKPLVALSWSYPSPSCSPQSGSSRFSRHEIIVLIPLGVCDLDMIIDMRFVFAVVRS